MTTMRSVQSHPVSLIPRTLATDEDERLWLLLDFEASRDRDRECSEGSDLMDGIFDNGSPGLAGREIRGQAIS